MKILRWVVKILFQISIFHSDVDALKNVLLTLLPPVVKRGHNCTLKCTYDLEDVPLYTVKWYRGNNEFYRYTPNEKPITKVLETPGINVDEEQSNSTQVVLQDVDFNLSGKFMCEVTTEKAFSTRQDVQIMTVVQLPETPPTISVSTEPLDSGDVLIAKCMSPRSRPPAVLKFLLNNKLVTRTDPLLISKVSQEFSWSDLLLNLTLTEEHLITGRLTLRCEARIENIYHKYAELKLNTARDPVPERAGLIAETADSKRYVIVADCGRMTLSYCDKHVAQVMSVIRHKIEKRSKTVIQLAALYRPNAPIVFNK